MVYGKCRSCGAQIVFARSATSGKRMPLNPEPDDELGNILVDGFGLAYAFPNRPAAVAYRDEHPDSDLGGSATHLSHFASCPSAGKHRGRGKAQAALL